MRPSANDLYRMKHLYLRSGWGTLAIVFLLAAAGCSKSKSKSDDPEPRATLVIKSSLTGDPNTMFYTEVSSKAGGEIFLSRTGGNINSEGLEIHEVPNRPLGEYRFRLTCPNVVRGQLDPAYPPQGVGHAELSCNGRTLAKLDLDLSKLVFENDTCRQTVTVQVR